MELLLFVSSHCPVCPRAERIVKNYQRLFRPRPYLCMQGWGMGEKAI